MSRIGSQRDKPAHPEEGSSDPVAREFKIGLGLNEAMRAVLRLEQLLRRAGLRSPIGGSRVIVAQKRG
jgi:hypothetical protein